jgi:hypothetical protein
VGRTTKAKKKLTAKLRSMFCEKPCCTSEVTINKQTCSLFQAVFFFFLRNSPCNGVFSHANLNVKKKCETVGRGSLLKLEFSRARTVRGSPTQTGLQWKVYVVQRIPFHEVESPHITPQTPPNQPLPGCRATRLNELPPQSPETAVHRVHKAPVAVFGIPLRLASSRARVASPFVWHVSMAESEAAKATERSTRAETTTSAIITRRLSTLSRGGLTAHNVMCVRVWSARACAHVAMIFACTQAHESDTRPRDTQDMGGS